MSWSEFCHVDLGVSGAQCSVGAHGIFVEGEAELVPTGPEPKGWG